MVGTSWCRTFIHLGFKIVMPDLTRKTSYIYVIFLLLITSFIYFMAFHRSVLISKLQFLSGQQELKLNFKNYGFHPVNDKGVYSFWNVCIEAVRNPQVKQISVNGMTVLYNETKHIVIYDSFYRDGDQRLYVAGSANSYSHEWDVTFTRKPIPNSHTFNPVTAFFIVPTCPANFHHFWIDEFVPLYAVIKQGNRLKAGSDSRLFYKQPMFSRQDFGADCTNVSTFESLLSKSLYIKFPHVAFFQVPDMSCFSSGVFGITTATLSRPREVVEQVLQSFGENLWNKRSKDSDCTVLFLDRNTRKILNIDKLMAIANSISSISSCRFFFQDISVEQQLHAARNARVMVGVHGAGLQWAVFMPPSSHLVEVAWPQKHWGFYFQDYVRQYGITHHKVVASHVKPNWTSYENRVRGGTEVKMEERLEILSGKKVGNSFDNFWKWADVIVDEIDFVNVLQDIVMNL